jgi:hypothetical protein
MQLTPEEKLLAAALRLAIRYACKHPNEHVREEARRWLWDHAPGVAEIATEIRR